MIVKTFDSTFSHTQSLSYLPVDFIKFKFLKRKKEIEKNDIIIVTDNFMKFKFDIRLKVKKIGLIIEPKSLNPRKYSFKEKDFVKVLTFDRSLLEKNKDLYKFCPSSSNCWINQEDIKIHDKTKLVSVIASNKTQIEGHRLRHEVNKKFNDKINIENVYGGGYKWIENKITGCKDYAFQIVIENSKFDYYFTEKIIDSFATGCVPIYWGCPSIGDFFNINGILTFNNLDELEKILDDISLEKYQEMLPYVKENFEKAERYFRPEHWILEEIKNL